ncbi:MAG: ABC transporter ATP-binding protein [Actinomycetota bacterium]|nr:ABC transporter ATP-binding protein [Actinomycetota bacterium]
MLSVENLDFAYNGHPVLKDMNFEVSEHSFISILGPNGSGKSTIINIISAVLKNYGGSIHIAGHNLARLSPRQAARLVAVVPQSTNPGFNFTVRQMIAMGRYPYMGRLESFKQEDNRRVEDIIDKVQIGGLAHRKYNELSGGEKQRVIIAQALVQDTPLLLLDEPTSHLDINFQIELMEQIKRLNTQDGKTIIGIFHDLNLAIQYSDKVMFLKEGSIFDYGPVAEVITEENIERVFGSEVYVAKNPFTGKLYINPTFNLTPPEKRKVKDVRVHVIAGGGAASPVMSLLYSHGYIVSCGVVNNLDTDLSTAQRMGIPFVSDAPFSPISVEAQNRNLKFIRGSDFIILPALQFGHGNFSNLVSARQAQQMGKKVMVLGKEDISSRDYTGGKATKIYNQIIKEGAEVLATEDQLLQAIGKGGK